MNPNSPPPLDPLRCSYNRADMNQFVDAWMRRYFGELPGDRHLADQWLRDSGLLRQFIQDHFPDK